MNSDGAGGSGVLCGNGRGVWQYQVVMVVVFDVVCDVGMVLIWC